MMVKKLLAVLCVACIILTAAIPASAREDTPVMLFAPDDMLAYIRVPGSASDDYPVRFYLPPALTYTTEYAKLYSYMFARTSDGIPATNFIWNASCVATYDSENNHLYSRCDYQLDPNSVTLDSPWFSGFVDITVSGYALNNVNGYLYPKLTAFAADVAREYYNGSEPFAVTYNTVYYEAVDEYSESPAPKTKVTTIPLASGHRADFDLVENNLPDNAYVTSCSVSFPAALLIFGNAHLYYSTVWSNSPTWSNYIKSGYGLYDFVEGWQRPYEVIDFEDIDLTTWLGNALGGVFDVPLFGGITLGTVLGTCIGIAIAIFILKRFAGG